ncbi:uncharacterized protein LOC129224667 isoform X2 [Uloborus diversus]|uniref:uncharacterized protein LOC129224667 isoform X2 n=1 Tax=Uloborus diversus TaxID=327109 RepID=UPI00240A7070|nr:uncharacterized protein LOC129224667 isoform X2 [Uloborus diversus]
MQTRIFPEKVGFLENNLGFPFPWLSRKHNAPKKYAVNPAQHDEAPMRSAVSQLSLNDYAPQWSLKTFQTAPFPDDAGYPSLESLNNNDYLNNNVSGKDPAMYRSVSTSALLEDPKEFLVNIDVSKTDDLRDNFNVRTSSDVRTCSRNDDHIQNNYNVRAFPNMRTASLNEANIQNSFNVHAFSDSRVSSGTEDNVQNSFSVHITSKNDPVRSPGGYVANDGYRLTLSCEDLIDSCAEEGECPPGSVPGQKAAVQQQLGTVLEEEAFLDPAIPADTESLASSIQHRSDESGYESDGTKNGNDEHSLPDTASRSDTHVQKFAALFHRLTSVSLTDSSKRDEPAKSGPTKSYEARSLRLRTPAMLSGLVQRHSGSKTPSPKDPFPPDPSPKSEDGKKSASARLGQFKAWTLDRKLLRSRWKKTALPDDKLDISVPVRRGSIFQSSLFPSSDSPVSHQPLETKSLPTLSDVPDCSLSNCGDLNYQLRLKKAGYKSTSTSSTAARRRLWLQSQLSGSDGEDPLSPESEASTPDVSRRIPSQLDLHEIVSVDLQKDEHGELGIYITGCTDSEKGVLGYIIVDFEKAGPAERSGKLLKGDELLIVNGQQLQGVSLEEARRLLRVPETEVHLLVARELSDTMCLKEDARLPPVPELHETADRCPRLRHWTSDVTPRTENRCSDPPSRDKADGERMGSGGICTLPRRPKSSQLSLRTVVFEKGPGRKSLGFSIVGGSDSPKGQLGFYVKTIFANGQAAETGCLREGDEIYTLNGQSLQGLSHSEAIAAFKKIKQGPVILHIGRRTNKKSSSFCETTSKLENNNSKSCSTLDNI